MMARPNEFAGFNSVRHLSESRMILAKMPGRTPKGTAKLCCTPRAEGPGRVQEGEAGLGKTEHATLPQTAALGSVVGGIRMPLMTLVRGGVSAAALRVEWTDFKLCRRGKEG